MNKLQILPKKRLIIVIGSLMVGGTETFLVRFLSYLSKLGWSIEVFTLSNKHSDLAQTLENNGVKVTEVLSEKDQKMLTSLPKPLERISRILLCLSRLSRYLKKENNKTILHLFLPEAYVLGMISTFLSGFKGAKVMSRRSLNNYQIKRPWVGKLERNIHRYLSLAIGNSKKVVKQLEEEGISSSKIKLIYNGLEIKEEIGSNMQSKNKTNLSSLLLQDAPNHIKSHLGETLIFIIVANLIPYKGHEDLLKAFSLIKSKINEPWLLLCVGRDQGILNKLTGIAKSFQLNQNILWLGERKDVAELLESSDVGLLTSHEEGFSNSILEYMATGLPVVVTDVGGNAEAVINDKTGFVVPAQNPESLANAILRLISDKNRMKNMGEAARERVIQHFTLEKCVNEHIHEYEKLLNK